MPLFKFTRSTKQLLCVHLHIYHSLNNIHKLQLWLLVRGREDYGWGASQRKIYPFLSSFNLGREALSMNYLCSIIHILFLYFTKCKITKVFADGMQIKESSLKQVPRLMGLHFPRSPASTVYLVGSSTCLLKWVNEWG